MRPTISVRRKGDSVYLKFMGNFSFTSSDQLLHALKKMVLSSLEFSHPGSQVFFTFKTHARVNLEKEWDKTGAGAKPPVITPSTAAEVKKCTSDSGWG